jgi:hypothetical protein
MHILKPGKPNHKHYIIIDACNIGRCSCGLVVDYTEAPSYKYYDKALSGGYKSGAARRK